LVMVTEIFKCHPCMVKKEATTSEKKKDMWTFCVCSSIFHIR
jgi:hypothetical protein